jgi:hypothetical protein
MQKFLYAARADNRMRMNRANGRTTAAVRPQLLSFHAHVDELSKVLVKGGD